MVDILTTAEEELRKRLDLSGAKVTRTSKTLVILVTGNSGGRSIGRCFTLHHDGAWELTSYPSANEQVRLRASNKRVLKRVGFPARDLNWVASTLSEALTGGVAA